MTSHDETFHQAETDALRDGLRECIDRETELICQVRNLEKQNRKLNDKLNRFRNLTPGRKRLYSLGRIAAAMEYEADELALDRERVLARNVESAGGVSQIRNIAIYALNADALYLHRLQWDFEQLREVVYPSDTPSHEWRRP